MLFDIYTIVTYAPACLQSYHYLDRKMTGNKEVASKKIYVGDLFFNPC